MAATRLISAVLGEDMSLLASVLFFVVPTDPPPLAHERAFEPREVRVATDTPKSIWQTAASGDATHLQSTLVCPASLSSFERSVLVPFDSFGFDVGCNFDRTGVGRITLFLTKRDRALADDFAEAQSALKQVMTAATPIVGAAPAPDAGLRFMSALYALPDGARTGLWVAHISGWTFKFRATYRATNEKEVLQTITALSEKVQTTAGVHLGLCAAVPVAERDGPPIADDDTLMQLSLVGGLAGQSQADDKVPAKTRWCAEEAVRDREAPLLFWRNIENDGADGPLDRLSLMTVGEPPICLVSANAMASLIMGETDDPGPPIHELSQTRDMTTYMFAYYRGCPALSTLAPLIRDVILGNKRPIASYNSETNTITLPSGSAKPDS